MEQPIEKIYTYEDILALGDDVRAELIDGGLYMMAPPSDDHQLISSELHGQIWEFLKDKPCKVLSAPFGFRPFKNEKESGSYYVEPDISVICSENKFDKKDLKGVPDLVIEILSPSSISHDRFVKLNLYQQAGVREYWIVSPFERSAEVLLLDENGQFQRTGVYTQTEKVKVNILPGCEIDLSKVFPGED